MTVVTATAARPIGADSFAHITDVPVSVAVEGSRLVVTFDADLTPAQVAAVRDFMASRDDADQAARANLAALRIAVADPAATCDDVKALALAVSAYLLGIEEA